MNLLQQAIEYRKSGISVIQIDHRTKKPLGSWLEFQERRAEERELKSWFGTDRVKSLAAVCGRISGGLVVIDFDVPGYYEQWRDGAAELADGLPVQRTGGGGYQVFLRCPEPGPNQKLAWHPSSEMLDGREIAIETRGEGGYVVVPPSLHPSGGTYEWIFPGEIPTVSQARADALLAVARKLDQAPYTARELAEQQRRAEAAKPKPRSGDGESVIDAYNRANRIEETLERYGYTRRGPYFCRPGAPDRHSVIIHSDNTSFHFSSNDPLSSPHRIDPFEAYLCFEHQGDIGAAVKAAAISLGIQRSGGAKNRQNGGSDRPEPEKSAAPTPEAEEQTGEPGRYHRTDTGNALRLVDKYGHLIRYNKEPFKKWFCWNGRNWEFDRTNRVYEYVDQVVRDIYAEVSGLDIGQARKDLAGWAMQLEGMKRQNALVSKAETIQSITMSAEQMDADPWLFNTRNGTLDLSDGDVVFREHRQEDCITRAAPVDYDPNARAPEWGKFLREIFSDDEELIQFLACAVGYSLTGDVSEQMMVFAYGTGANGKSVFFNTIEMLFGDFFYRAPAEMILQQKSAQIPADVANLKGRRFVVTSELEENRRLAEARVKALTGSETIEARKLYGDWFTFLPTHTLWMFGNHRPVIRGTDEGIWRRIREVPFTVTIPIERRKPMRQMLATFGEELPGILNWALTGYVRYREKGFPEPATMREAITEYRNDMDLIGKFISECCVENRSIDSNAKRVWQAYRGWCDEQGEHAMSGTQFYAKLRERGFQVRPGHANKSMISGLGLAEPSVSG